MLNEKATTNYLTTYHFNDLPTCEVGKNEDETDKFPFFAEMGDIRMTFMIMPTKAAVEERYYTIMAEKEIYGRENEISEDFANVPNSNKKVQELLNLGFSEERAKMNVALMSTKVDFRGISHEEQYEEEQDNYER